MSENKITLSCDGCGREVKDSDNAIMTEDDVLVCEDCYKALAVDTDCHTKECECDLCDRAKLRKRIQAWRKVARELKHGLVASRDFIDSGDSGWFPQQWRDAIAVYEKLDDESPSGDIAESNRSATQPAPAVPLKYAIRHRINCGRVYGSSEPMAMACAACEIAALREKVAEGRDNYQTLLDDAVEMRNELAALTEKLAEAERAKEEEK